VHQVPLVVAKVDRLTRSVAFLSRLLEAGVDVRFADLPIGGFIAYYRVSTGKPSLADIIPLSAASGYIYNIDAIGRCTAGLDESGFIASHAASTNGVVTISMRS
jgi:hypothetical protein